MDCVQCYFEISLTNTFFVGRHGVSPINLLLLRRFKKIIERDIRRRLMHNTANIPNKFTRCAYNIQNHSLGINSLILTGVMIPVGTSMFIFVTMAPICVRMLGCTPMET